MTGAAAAGAEAPARAPGVMRRLACFLYEGILLFGLVMVAALTYGLITNQRHALVGSTGLKATLFIVIGIYFVYFWVRHGQTLAMKTWHLRLQRQDGSKPGVTRAAARYALAWLWFLPALVIFGASGLRSGAALAATVVAGVLAYAWLARLRADRQFLHDVLCGTRVVDTRLPCPVQEKPR